MFVVVAVIFLALLSSAGLRATPGVLMLPLQKAFGWNVGVISSSAAIGIFLYGLVGPFGQLGTGQLDPGLDGLPDRVLAGPRR